MRVRVEGGVWQLLLLPPQYTQQHLNGQIAELQQKLQTSSEVSVRGRINVRSGVSVRGRSV